MMNLLVCAIVSYIITIGIVSSPHLEGIRALIRSITPWLGTKPYFIDCRLCMGFWVSLAVCLVYGSYDLTLPVYGLSYFMATQERR